MVGLEAQTLRWNSKEFIKSLQNRLRGDQFEIDSASVDEQFAVILGYWMKKISFRDEGILERCVARLDLELAAPQFQGNNPESVKVAEEMDGLYNYLYQDLDLPPATPEFAPPQLAANDLFAVACERAQAVDEHFNCSNAHAEAYKYPVGKASRLEFTEQLLMDLYACSLLDSSDAVSLTYPREAHMALLKNEFVDTKVGHWNSEKEWVPFPLTKPENRADQDFDHKTFTGDDFSELVLKDRHFFDCTFINVTFEGAYFSGARFTDCYFINCVLDGAYFESATCDAFLVFKNCSLLNADFTGFSAGVDGEMQFPDCDLRCATFVDSEIPGAVFDSARLDGVNFKNAFIGHASFTQAKAGKANFTNASGHVDFTLTTLTDANFNASALYSPNFYKCDLTRASLQEQASFHDASFIDCDLSQALMTDVNFTGALFVRTSLAEAQIEGTTFEAALAIDSDFSKATISQSTPSDGPRIIEIERLG